MNLTTKIAETTSDVRSGELLDSVRTVFAAKGFDKASMQDLAQAAGMSAGNFYRYFPSKDAIIEAMVQRDLARSEQSFDLVLKSDDPLPLLRDGIMRELDTNDCDGGAIWAEIRAAATRQSQVASLFERLEARISENLVQVFARIAGLDYEAAEAKFSAHATMLFLLIQGIKMRRTAGDDFENSPLRALAMRAIDDLLSDVSKLPPAKAGLTESA